MTKLGFIGFGNIATAFYKGLSKVRDDIEFGACAKHYDALKEKCLNTNINVFKHPQEVIDYADVVVIAIKPYQMEDVLPALDFKGKPILSFVAGYLFEQYNALLPNTHHLSAIPNTPIEVAKGVISVEDVHSLTEEQYKVVMGLLQAVALCEVVDSKHVSIANIISGCTPAYAAMFIEALGDAGVKHGLTRKQAYRLVAAMMAGTGEMILQNDIHPAVAKDAVCSPAGITIKGVASLEEDGFRGAIIKAIDKAVNK